MNKLLQSKKTRLQNLRAPSQAAIKASTISGDPKGEAAIEWLGVTFGDDSVTVRRVVTTHLGSEPFSSDTLHAQLTESVGHI